MDDKVLVVLSHSSYSDLWPSLEVQYARYKIHNEFRLILATDLVPESISLDYFNVLYYPENLSWLDAFKNVLSKLKSVGISKAIVTFDDLYPIHFDIHTVLNIYDCEEEFWTPLANVPSNGRFFRFFRNTFSLNRNPYVGSLVFSIINIDYFIKLLSRINDQWTPWQYERNISNYLDKELGVNSGNISEVIRYINLVERGHINKVSKMLLKLNYKLVLKSSRRVKPLTISFFTYIYGYLWRFLNNLGVVNVRRKT